MTINYKDVNRKLLLEKETWTFYLLSFSCIRNNLHIMCKRKKKPHDVTCPHNNMSNGAPTQQLNYLQTDTVITDAKVGDP